jgi:protein gp37
MSDKTGIEWTDATWNPVTGCTKVSPGCDHCYAETFAERFRGVPGHHFERGFDVVVRPERLDIPLRWTKPRRIFVNSMSDLFHDGIPDEFIARAFAVMAWAPRHTFQILTKRHARMRSLLSSSAFYELVDREWCGVSDWFWGRLPDLDFTEAHPHGDRWPLPNVWLGVSVETQQWADIRIPALLDTPAAVRFLSCEPLLGPVRPFLFDSAQQRQIDWVIVGGESGPGARPMHPDWARSLRDLCTGVGVPFLFKQHGEWVPGSSDDHLTAAVARDNGEWLAPSHRLWDEKPHTDAENRRGWAMVHRAGKKAAGRLLDGRTWDEYPVVSA